MVLSFCHGTARQDVQAHAPSCPLLQVRTSLALVDGTIDATEGLRKEGLPWVLPHGLKYGTSMSVQKVLVSCWEIPRSIEYVFSLTVKVISMRNNLCN